MRVLDLGAAELGDGEDAARDEEAPEARAVKFLYDEVGADACGFACWLAGCSVR